MKFHRFNPYTDDYIRQRIEKQLAETARRKKYGFPANYQPMDNPIVKLKVQRKRNVSMRAKRLKVSLATVSLCLAWLIMHPQPAAACHKFSRWYYPYPQHCGVTHARLSHIRVLSNSYTVHSIANNHNVEGLLLPTLDDNLAWDMPLETPVQLELYQGMQRQRALIKLKGEN